jgi:hypothetical protein
MGHGYLMPILADLPPSSYTIPHTNAPDASAHNLQPSFPGFLPQHFQKLTHPLNVAYGRYRYAIMMMVHAAEQWIRQVCPHLFAEMFQHDRGGSVSWCDGVRSADHDREFAYFGRGRVLG